MTVTWVRNEATLYGTSKNGSCNLIVEALPMADSWDWAVWRSGTDIGRRFGHAPSAEIAIKEAQNAPPGTCIRSKHRHFATRDHSSAQ